MSRDAQQDVSDEFTIDRLCDAFEVAWAAYVDSHPNDSTRPCIEEYLASVNSELASRLFRELLAVELSYCAERPNDRVSQDTYVDRFPHETDTILELLSHFGLETSPRKIVVPSQLGRYVIECEIGTGAFATVYRASDPMLLRDVAIKVPRRDRSVDREAMRASLAEARALASLQHAHIVPVYDVAETEDGWFYIVSQLIEGTTLTEHIQRQQMGWRDFVRLFSSIAEGLHYAHGRGLVHRDVKPANILIDSMGHPFLTDFGLALADADFGRETRQGGTIAYMSPEQARGEGHLVDGRSDIFSLGVTLYEALTSDRPFRGNNRRQVLDHIVQLDPRPPRMINDTIPTELERICLKAISKRACDRYNTALDMANDLRMLEQMSPSESATSEPTSTDTSVRIIVPKGLAPFDEGDADFFLGLLPGPRVRGDIPQSVHFWKSRIEATDTEVQFRVGLIYGPSGCGKTSFLRAGLLPVLRESIVALRIECNATDTERRLLDSLKRSFPELPARSDIAEAVTAIRRKIAPTRGAKVLIVLDQFEQWLHARHGELESELVSAIRQCDGQHVQCLLMVRDDFWLAVSRLLDALDVDLIEGHNTSFLDLFDQRHARKVLIEFGRAYGCLPDDVSRMTVDQNQFVDHVITELAQDSKIMTVRLAVFAEMVKGQPWCPATLRQVDGTAGVGVMFLDHSFVTSANPTRRRHQFAARRILQSLLPESEQVIKGLIRSAAELRSIAEYENKPRDFAELLRILDQEMRLISPLDAHVGDEVVPSLNGDDVRYQLTHDYLIGALRRWLTREQRKTRRGRAELLLVERTATWGLRRDARLLPTPLELVRFLILTRPRKWTSTQRAMILKSIRRSAAGTLSVCVLMLLAFGLWTRHSAHRLCDQLLALRPNEAISIPALMNELSKHKFWAVSYLRDKTLTDSTPAVPRMRAYVALSRLNGQFPILPMRWRDFPLPPEELTLLLDQFQSTHQEGTIQTSRRLAELAGDNENASRQAAYHYVDVLYNVAILARVGNKNGNWSVENTNLDDDGKETVKDRLVTSLIRHESFADIAAWCEILKPCRNMIKSDLEQVCAGESRLRSDQDRERAAAILAEFYAADAPLYLVNLLLDAEPYQFSQIIRRCRLEELQYSDHLISILRDALAGESGVDIDKLASRRANATILWMRAGLAGDELLELMSSDDSLGFRRLLLERASLLTLTPKTADRYFMAFASSSEAATTFALLLSKIDQGLYSKDVQQDLQFDMQSRYWEKASSGVHGAAWHYLHSWCNEASLDPSESTRDDRGLAWRSIVDTPEQNVGALVVDKVSWYRSKFVAEHTREMSRHTLAIFPNAGRAADAVESISDASLQGPSYFAIGFTEVTRSQFQAMIRGFSPELGRKFVDVCPRDDSPIVGVSLFDAAAYCNRLSSCAELKQADWCYEFWKDGEFITGQIDRQLSDPAETGWEEGLWQGVELRLVADWRQRHGYRLPTEWEWGTALGPGFHHNHQLRFLPDYAWLAENTPVGIDSQRTPQTVGQKLPNTYGLFDMYGNVSEWCHPQDDNNGDNRDGQTASVVLCGGSIDTDYEMCGIHEYMTVDGSVRDIRNGFRIARTIDGVAP